MSSQKSHSDGASKVASVLASRPQGLTMSQLRSRLTGVPRSAIVAEIHLLTSHGKISLFRGTKYQWIGGALPTKPEHGESDSPESVGLPEASSTSQTYLERLPRDTRWSQFRRLCLYYAECIRLEDRAKVSEYAEKLNARFVAISGQLNWRGLSGGASQALTIKSEWNPFIRYIRNRSRSMPRLFIGAPIDVHVFQDGNKVVAPVFVQQVEFSVHNDMLHLSPTGPVEINHGWLEKRFRQRDDQRAFAEICGFEEPQREDDDKECSANQPSFDEAIEAFYKYYREGWREAAGLRSLSSDPPIDELKDKGIYNRAVLISQPSLKYANRLYQELQWLAQSAKDEDFDSSALRLLFPHTPVPLPKQPDSEVQEEPAEVTIELADVAEYESLNRQQRVACRHAMTEDMLVVTGPPGTGKSRVVAQAMANAAIRRSPVLFASRNHQALEAVIPRLNDIVEPDVLAIRLARPYNDASPETLTQTIVNALTSTRPPGITERLSEATENLNRVVANRFRGESTWEKVFSLYEQLDDAQISQEEAIAELPAAYGDKIHLCPCVPTMEEIKRLVLKLQVFRKPPAGYFSQLIWRFFRWFKGRLLVQEAKELDLNYCRNFDRDPLAYVRLDDAKVLEKVLDRLEHWQVTAQAISNTQRLFDVRRQLELLPSLKDCQSRFFGLQEQIIDSTRRTLLHVANSYGVNLSGELREKFGEIRGELLNQGDNPGRQSTKLQKAIRQIFPQLLREIPLWATTNLSAGRTIPRSPGAFDLLIIDEASQCDIASVIPLLYRSRRIMTVGDPMQLRHVSTLGKETDKRLRERFGLADMVFGRFSFRVNSFFDLVSSAKELEHNVYLNEHHRCHQAIADYCNDVFYKRTLSVMTSPDHLVKPRRDGQPDGGIRWTHVPADAERASRGGAISRGQIDAIVGELRRLSEDDFDGTVGVVTPFRAQANRIRDNVEREFGHRLPEKWRLLIDTADGFQGDERDAILMSIPCGPDMPRGAQWFIAHEKNRFNVAASRARALLHVFSDRDWCRTCEIQHLKSLHKAWENQSSDGEGVVRTDLIGPKWEPALAEAMQQAGIPFRQQYPTCGRYLDFAVFVNSSKLNIEVDGEAFHRDSQGRRKIEDLYRDRVLIAHDWKVMRFWVYELREDMAGCVNQIRSEYEKLLAD